MPKEAAVFCRSQKLSLKAATPAYAALCLALKHKVCSEMEKHRMRVESGLGQGMSRHDLKLSRYVELPIFFHYTHPILFTQFDVTVTQVFLHAFINFNKSFFKTRMDSSSI